MSIVNTKEYMDDETTSMLIEALEGEFFEILKAYMKNAEDQISQLRGLDIKSKDELIMLTHTLKGASGNIGAIYLSSICNELETGLIMNEISDPSPLIDKIEKTFKSTCELLYKLIKEAE